MKALLVLALALPLWAQTAVYPSSIVTDSQLARAKNNFTARLAGSISASAGTVTLRDVQNGPAAINMLITIDVEIVKVTGVTGNILSVIRGYDYTAASTHTTGSPVAALVVAWHHNALAAEIKAIETALGPNLSNATGGARAACPADGSTDATTCLQAAITSAAGGVLTIPAGTYKISKNLVVPANTAIVGDGRQTVLAAVAPALGVYSATNANPSVITTTSAHGFVNGDRVVIRGAVGNTAINGIGYIVANAASNSFTLLDGSGNPIAGNGAYTGGGVASYYINLFYTEGTIGPVLASTVDINSNWEKTTSATVTVSDSSSIAAGDYVLLESARDTINYPNVVFSQMGVVLSSVAGVITTRESIAIPMLTSWQTHSVRKVTPVQGIRIANLTIDGSACAGLSRGFLLKQTSDLVLRDLTVQNFVYGSGIYLLNAYQPIAENITVLNSGTVAYGYSESDFWAINASAGHFRGIRSLDSPGFGLQWTQGAYLTLEDLYAANVKGGRAIKISSGRSNGSNHIVTNNTSGVGGYVLAYSAWNNRFSNVRVDATPNWPYGGFWTDNETINNTVTGLSVNNCDTNCISVHGVRNRLLDLSGFPDGSTETIYDGGTQSVIGGIVTGWVEPSLLNSWINVSSSTFGAAAYTKLADGAICFRGHISSGASGTNPFTIPAWSGLYPSIPARWPVSTISSDGNTLGTAELSVYQGSVVIRGHGSNSVFLSGCTPAY